MLCNLVTHITIDIRPGYRDFTMTGISCSTAECSAVISSIVKVKNKRGATQFLNCSSLPLDCLKLAMLRVTNRERAYSDGDIA